MTPTANWESGFRSLGPPRLQTLRCHLTRLDHPEWLWELRRSECNPRLLDDGSVAQSEIATGELLALAGGFLRFFLAAISVRAKANLASLPYPSIRFGRKLRQ